MKNKLIRHVLTILFLAFSFILFNSSQPADFQIDIQVSPNVLNISSMGTVVTIHTDIPFGAVAAASVKLNEIPISWWKSDNLGYFVAKFNMYEVKVSGLLIDDYNTFTLCGVTKDGELFEGSSDILVIKTKN